MKRFGVGLEGCEMKRFGVGLEEYGFFLLVCVRFFVGFLGFVGVVLVFGGLLYYNKGKLKIIRFCVVGRL